MQSRVGIGSQEEQPAGVPAPKQEIFGVEGQALREHL